MFALFALCLLANTARVTAAACNSNLLIDNFSSWATNKNTLGSWTSDDKSMTSATASGGVLTFIPRALSASSSYFYENLPCQSATSNGYTALSFKMTAPAGSSVTLELQTKTSCSATAITRSYYTVTGLTNTAQTVTVPLTAFSGGNLGAVTAVVWAGFSKTAVAWKISDIQFQCGTAGQTSSTSQPPPASSSSSRSTTTRTTTSSAVTSTSTSTSTSTKTTTTTTSSSSPPAGSCTNVLVDDWESQSRLMFLGYNSLLAASGDDQSMTSVVVGSSNTVTLTPKDKTSYFYTNFGCFNAKDVYGGLTLRIKAPAGTTLSVQLQARSTCAGEDTQFILQTSTALGWTFDGTLKLYTIPFSKFPNLDTTKLSSLFFTAFSQPATFGPIQMYCGNTPAEYIVPTTSVNPGPSYTVPAPAGTATALVVDTFGSTGGNDLGFWHGADDGMTLTWATRSLSIVSPDPDYSFYTQLSGGGCTSYAKYSGSYLHVVLKGSNKFTIALQQHNSACNDAVSPYPETWDSLEAARYTSAAGTDIYIPISHFNIDLSRVIGLAFKGFYTSEKVTLTKVEIVPTIPAGIVIPNKLPSGNLVFSCKRPNSIAFAIDDGDPAFAQEVVEIVRSEGIKVTFFTVGLPLKDRANNLSNIYIDMKARGHQIALHSYTHPKMEGLPDYQSIDWEYQNDIKAMEETFGAGFYTPYFRPPFGNEGARMRQRLAQVLGTDSPYFVNWNIDVEDWLWATSNTPEKQLEAFKRDLAKGGNLVVLHYLYPSTVGYLREFIQLAKATGKQLMRVDQCMMDPNAPPL